MKGDTYRYRITLEIPVCSAPWDGPKLRSYHSDNSAILGIHRINGAVRKEVKLKIRQISVQGCLKKGVWWWRKKSHLGELYCIQFSWAKSRSRYNWFQWLKHIVIQWDVSHIYIYISTGCEMLSFCHAQTPPKKRKDSKLLPMNPLTWWILAQCRGSFQHDAPSCSLLQYSISPVLTWITKKIVGILTSFDYKWVFLKIGVPQNGWFIVENPLKMDDLGIPLFLETPKWLLNKGGAWCHSPRNFVNSDGTSSAWG